MLATFPTTGVCASSSGRFKILTCVWGGVAGNDVDGVLGVAITLTAALS